jgi:cytochrome c556
MMTGRHAAPPGTQPGAGELSPNEIDQRIASSRDAFVQFAQGLRLTATKALNAIDHKDSEALLQAGGDIDEACEACHVTYWYPDQHLYAK